MNPQPGSFPSEPKENASGPDPLAVTKSEDATEPGQPDQALEASTSGVGPAYASPVTVFDDPRLRPETALELENLERREEERRRRRRRLRHIGLEIVQTFLLAVLIFLAVRTLAQNFRVEGSSMEPGLHDGEYLLVNKAIYFRINLGTLEKYIPFIDGGDKPERNIFRGPGRGDVVVFRFPRDPGRDFIKRIIGVPGDTVEVVDGAVFVNDVLLDEPYILSESRSDFERETVPEEHYFVLGDNRSNSSDSRSWGFVPRANIIGQAMFTYWPLADLGGVGNRSIDLGFVRLPLPW